METPKTDTTETLIAMYVNGLMPLDMFIKYLVREVYDSEKVYEILKELNLIKES